MLKFLIIIFLVGYVFYKVGGVLFRALTGTLGGGQYSRENFQGRSNQNAKPKGGNVNIDYVPKDQQNKKDFDGGEYVDYEELK